MCDGGQEKSDAVAVHSAAHVDSDDILRELAVTLDLTSD